MQSPITRVQVQLSLPSAIPASCNRCLCPFSCGTCPRPHVTVHSQLHGQGLQDCHLRSSLRHEVQSKPCLPRNRRGAGLPPLLWPPHRPASICPQTGPPVWRALRVMIQGFWFLYQFFDEEITVSRGGAHSPRGQGWHGMNRRDFSPGREGTEEPVLALEQTCHSPPQLNIVPSLCFFCTAAL